MVKVSVDKEKCIGCGACAATCPRTFEMFEGKARVKKGKADIKEVTCEKEAAENCPVEAIAVK